MVKICIKASEDDFAFEERHIEISDSDDPSDDGISGHYEISSSDSESDASSLPYFKGRNNWNKPVEKFKDPKCNSALMPKKANSLLNNILSEGLKIGGKLFSSQSLVVTRQQLLVTDFGSMYIGTSYRGKRPNTKKKIIGETIAGKGSKKG